MYKFSNGYFYPYVLIEDYIAAGSWPQNGVDVDDAVFNSFIEKPSGKKVGVGADGMPVWVDDEQQIVNYASIAISQKNELMAAATLAIAPLQDAVDLETATDQEVALLKKWKQYRVALNRLDLSTAPDITWPALPTAVPA